MPNEFPAKEDRPGHKSKEKSKNNNPKQMSQQRRNQEPPGKMTPGSERGIEAFFRRILIILTHALDYAKHINNRGRK